MPREDMGRLRVHGEGLLEVSLLREYLADLEFAYNSYLTFESSIESLRRASRYYPFPFDAYLILGTQLRARRGAIPMRGWSPTPEEVASLVPHSERLVLKAAQLSSPGYWDFLGKLNPLEVIRHYLNDRHERRKDRDYRESAEARRLRLENLKLENQVLRERIEIARGLGATERDLAPLLNELVYRPLQALDRHQDRNVLEYAEVEETDDWSR